MEVLLQLIEFVMYVFDKLGGNQRAIMFLCGVGVVIGVVLVGLVLALIISIIVYAFVLPVRLIIWIVRMINLDFDERCRLYDELYNTEYEEEVIPEPKPIAVKPSKKRSKMNKSHRATAKQHSPDNRASTAPAQAHGAPITAGTPETAVYPSWMNKKGGRLL